MTVRLILAMQCIQGQKAQMKRERNAKHQAKAPNSQLKVVGAQTGLSQPWQQSDGFLSASLERSCQECDLWCMPTTVSVH